MILCDSDILIDVSRKFPPAVAWYFGSDGAGSELVVPGIVLMELIEGCRSQQELTQIQKLRSLARVAWPAEEALNYSVDLLQAFNLSHGLRKYDALIAATALALHVPLHTFNVRHYRFIPGLRTIQPYSKALDR